VVQADQVCAHGLADGLQPIRIGQKDLGVKLPTVVAKRRVYSSSSDEHASSRHEAQDEVDQIHVSATLPFESNTPHITMDCRPVQSRRSKANPTSLRAKLAAKGG
jgi:hypothetical protein